MQFRAFARPRTAILLVLFGLLTAFVTLGAPTPAVASDAPTSDLLDDADARRAEVLRHRVEEARRKAERMEARPQLPQLRTPNQRELDFTHYDLVLDLDPGTSTLSGVVTATADLIGAPLTTVELHLNSGMSVSAVTLNGAPTTFTHASGILTVDLDRTYTLGETVVVAVTYSGNPAGNGTFGWDSHNGSEMIWTLSEPFGARDWWPCSDNNWDKASSVDLHVTVPDHLVVASNGLLLSDVDHGATRTFHWHCSYPIAPYLVSLAIHPYTQYSDWYTPQGGGAPMEVQFFVYPDHFTTVQPNYAQTVPMIDAFAQAWGEYPFVNEKYGHAEFEWGGGMEHQTCSSMGGWSIDLIAHELAHQWFGDDVTCKTFRHIWLNEGFATWAEAYWREQTEGFETYKEYMDFAAYYGPGTIFVESLTNFNEIFDSNLSYNKASWVVHMLRGILGDTGFFAALAQYRATYGGAGANTEDLQGVMESVSGLDLSAFFQQWIYGEYFPVYRYAWSPAPGGVEVTIDQIQTNTGLFTMPIPLRVEASTGTYDLTVQNALATETYLLSVPGDVEDVVLDPDRWILRQVESVISSPTFDQGILLVNGVDWATYGAEITNAYEARAFWGDLPISFWDTFAEPGGGYPSTLPTPIGHGPVPSRVMGEYSTVIWVGNHYNGDLADWFESPIDSYLDVGGNLLLMSRRGQSFLDADLSTYLGVTWSQAQITLSNCTAQVPELVNIAFTGSQSWNDAVSLTLGPNSTLLFQDTGGNNRGTGVRVQPPGGGEYRPEGGQLVYLAGRPYRMNAASLQTNVEFIVENYFGEPYDAPVGTPEIPAATQFRLGAPRPNPFGDGTSISFSLREAGRTELVIYDAAGRRVRELVHGELSAGPNEARWDGRDQAGRRVAAGVYFLRLRSGEQASSRSVVHLR